MICTYLQIKSTRDNDCSQKHVEISREIARATVCLHRDNMAEVPPQLQSVVGQAVRVIDAQVRGLLFY